MEAVATIQPHVQNELERKIKKLEKHINQLNRKLNKFHQAKYPCRDIIRATSDFYNVSVRDILSERRAKWIVPARHMAMYLCVSHTTYGYETIARVFGRDHTTIIYAHWKVNDRIKTLPTLKQHSKTIMQLIKRRNPQ